MNAMPRVAVVVWAVLIVTSGRPAMAQDSEETQVTEPANAEEVGAHITVSKQTTFVTEPLDEDGYVDYVAALNNAASEGVTPENNAAAALWQAFGPADIPEEIRERYYEMLGMSPLPDEGDYFVHLEDFLLSEGVTDAKLRTDFEKRLREASNRPWTREEFPVLAQWLERNQEPLDLIVEAVRRPKYYMPLIAPDDTPSLVMTWAPDCLNLRDAGSAICTRAMLRIKAGEAEDAWRDLLACHRLGVLSGQNGFVVDWLIAVRLHRIACWGEIALANNCTLTAEQATRFLGDLGRLPPMGKFARAIGLYERCMTLDAATLMSRKGPTVFGEKREPSRPRPDMKEFLEGKDEFFARVAPDWNVSLRVINKWFDRAVDAAGKPTRLERVAAAADLRKGFAEMIDNAKRSRYLTAAATLLTADVFGARGLFMGRCFVGLWCAAIERFFDYEDWELANFALSRTVLALAAYRADNGSYPEELGQLVPNYLPDLPRDGLADAPLRYRQEGSGYLLYSVGINGKDDGGRGKSVRSGNAELGDDLVVRTAGNER